MRPIAVLLLAAALAADEAAGPPGLDSKDVLERVAAVQALAEKGAPDAEALLARAVKDRDYEVVHRAVEALGARGTAASLDLLTDLAVSGPTRSIRLSAALSAKRISAVAAGAALLKRLKGDEAVAAAEALGIVADPAAGKDLERLAKKKGKDTGPLRRACVDAIGALGDPKRIPFFTECLKDEDIGVRAAAVRGLAATKDPSAIAPMRDGLNEAAITNVMERRYLAAIRSLLLATSDPKKHELAATMIVQSFGMGPNPESAARFARLFGVLGDAAAPVGPVEEYARLLLSLGVSHANEGVRCASIRALGRMGRAETYDRLASIAGGDPSVRTRFHALREAVRLKGDLALPLLLDRVGNDADPMIREEAAVILGKRRLADAVPALVQALGDKQWEVCVGAAVSLGRIRDPRALAALVALLGDKDWRRRGGGTVGLGWIRQKEAIPHLIDMLRDKEPAVARTALEFLRHISGEKLDENVKSWRAWWEKWQETFVFLDRDAEAKEAKRYGYAVQPRKVYEDMDIVVLVTRAGGDNIQLLLTDYGIEHRTVRAAAVQKCGLAPHALFIANCPGEIVDDDVSAIQFYVHAGGYLFASCWSLQETIERCFPGVVRKYPLPGQVLGLVLAEPVPVESPLTRGVFAEGCQPLFTLEGAHLIDVMDPERFEVLIDSPDTATRWGEGNLAGWFTIGHGLVLDSVNHFDLQGMKEARLSDEKERMGFAMNHLGYDYAELRELREKGIFLKQPTAIRGTRDMTIFRFITTFVRQKRLADEE
jgi:HEAT repeat protein